MVVEKPLVTWESWEDDKCQGRWKTSHWTFTSVHYYVNILKWLAWIGQGYQMNHPFRVSFQTASEFCPFGATKKVEYSWLPNMGRKKRPCYSDHLQVATYNILIGGGFFAFLHVSRFKQPGQPAVKWLMFKIFAKLKVAQSWTAQNRLIKVTHVCQTKCRMLIPSSCETIKSNLGS